MKCIGRKFDNWACRKMYDLEDARSGPGAHGLASETIPCSIPSSGPSAAAQLVNHHTIRPARMQLYNLGFCVAVDAI